MTFGLQYCLRLIPKTLYVFNQVLNGDTMAILTIEVLKKLIENVPNDFSIEYNSKTTVFPIDDKVEIDISGKRLIFK